MDQVQRCPILNRRLSQESVVFLIAAGAFAIASVLLPGFLSQANLLNLVRGVSVLGILGLGMGAVVIGRGIDLSMVSVMAIGVAWYLTLVGNAWPSWEAASVCLAATVAIGLINGVLVAYAEVSPLFATLAVGIFLYGVGRSRLIHQDLVPVPANQSWLLALGDARFGGLPVEIVVFAGIAAALMLALRYTVPGRFIYWIGDNPLASRITGVPVRFIIVLQYVASALIAFVAGMVTAVGLRGMNVRIINSTLLYDVILVVVLGGIGLNGGRGGVRNVIVGTVLIGILLNAMTILDLSDNVQNLVKAAVLLLALVIDSVINPRDVQTEQNGDI